MKYYGEKNNENLEYIKYEIEKFKKYFSRYLVLKKSKRIIRKNQFEYTFTHESPINEKNKYAIPKGKYYKPIGIYSTDIIEKSKIKELKKGIKKLLVTHKSHKFLNGSNSLDEIISNIDSIDDTYSSYFASIKCGRFDFITDKKINDVVDYFDIIIREFNASYLAIEVHIYLSKKKINDIIELINNNFCHKRGYIVDGFANSKKKSGGKKIKLISHYNNAHLKSEIINEKMIEIKWILFNELKKYIPLVLNSINIMPPSVNIYNTNIYPSDKDTRDFFSSVGINQYNGQFINEKEKLFFCTEITFRNRYPRKPTDLIFLVNEERCDSDDGFYSFGFKTMTYFEDIYQQLFKFLIVNTLIDKFASTCVYFKKLVNGLKVKRNKLKTLLIMRYKFELEIAWFKNVTSEIDWEIEKSHAIDKFAYEPNSRWYNVNRLVNKSIMGHKKIQKKIDLIQRDIDQKIQIIKHLDEFKSSKQNLIINIVMIVLTATTLFFILYPENTNIATTFAANTFTTISNLLRKLKMTY